MGKPGKRSKARAAATDPYAHLTRRDLVRIVQEQDTLLGERNRDRQQYNEREDELLRMLNEQYEKLARCTCLENAPGFSGH